MMYNNISGVLRLSSLFWLWVCGHSNLSVQLSGWGVTKAFLRSVGLPATRRLALGGQIVGLHGFCRRLQSLHLIKISAKEGLTAFLGVPKNGFSLLANSGKTGLFVIEKGKWCSNYLWRCISGGSPEKWAFWQKLVRVSTEVDDMLTDWLWLAVWF